MGSCKADAGGITVSVLRVTSKYSFTDLGRIDC